MPKVFFSYSHADEQLRDILERHLSMLKRQGLIDSWHDRKILAGDDFGAEIDANLDSADIVLLLVSVDFLHSEYCFCKEMLRAMERHAAGLTRVVPVILRPCDWQTAPFGKLQAVPTNGKAITTWANHDEAFTDVARQLRAIVESATPTAGGRRPTSVPQTAAAKPSDPRSATPANLPRSSNLRIRQMFTERDRDQFLAEAFEFMARFFEGSTEELLARHADIDGRFTQVDARCFAVVIYRNGKTATQCSIRIDGLGGRSSGVAYTQDANCRGGAFNEMLSVEADDQALYLKPLGMAWSGGNSADKHLSPQGAAEYYWAMLIRPLQD